LLRALFAGPPRDLLKRLDRRECTSHLHVVIAETGARIEQGLRLRQMDEVAIAVRYVERLLSRVSREPKLTCFYVKLQATNPI
jgi:hypothetical protein